MGSQLVRNNCRNNWRLLWTYLGSNLLYDWRLPDLRDGFLICEATLHETGEAAEASKIRRGNARWWLLAGLYQWPSAVQIQLLRELADMVHDNFLLLFLEARLLQEEENPLWNPRELQGKAFSRDWHRSNPWTLKDVQLLGQNRTETSPKEAYSELQTLQLGWRLSAWTSQLKEDWHIQSPTEVWTLFRSHW